MPRIKAFQALRPPAELAESVACVPYDVVNRSEAAALADGNPNSFLHVIRPDIDLPENVGPYDDAVYEMAKTNLAKLTSNGALVRDHEDCLFLYRQSMNGQSQTGLVCCSHVDDYESNLILKHEKTRPAKEDDRTGRPAGSDDAQASADPSPAADRLAEGGTGRETLESPARCRSSDPRWHQ